MLVIGLTGGVAMGKTTTASFFAEAGIATFDADACVHQLYRGEAVSLIEAAFPGTTSEGVVDRTRLGDLVFGQSSELDRLEAIVHPLVQREEVRFLDRLKALGTRTVVLDIPLLLETPHSVAIDLLVVVTASAPVQRARVLARPRMTEQRFDLLKARQLPDEERRRRAHFVVDGGRGMAAARRAVRDILRALAPAAAGR